MKKRVCMFALCFVLAVQPRLPSGPVLPRQPEYLQQQQQNSCTLCAATMLIRNACYINGSPCWSQLTEPIVGATAWSQAGLYWQWDISLEDQRVGVSHESVNGLDAEQLRRLLTDHPEGLVLYCGGAVHHGVFLMEYTGDVFYCADPAVGYCGKKIPLDRSLLGTRLGTQEEILNCVTGYWYISGIDTSPSPAEVVLREDIKLQ